MFTISEKRKIILITLILLMSIVFAMVGCGQKDNEVLSYTMKDDGEAPSAPDILSANPEYLYNQEENVDSSSKVYSVLIQWKAVSKNLKGDAKSNIIGYRIYRNNKSTPIGSTDVGVTLYEDFDYKNLHEGGQYTYYVSAIDSLMRETFSDAVKVTLNTQGVEPHAPQNFYVIPSENKVIVLSWEKPDNDDACTAAGDPICKYKITRKDPGASKYTTIATVPSDVFVFYDDTIMENQSYSYRIYAVTTSGNVGPKSSDRSIRFTYSANDYLAPPTSPENLIVEPDNTSGIANAKKLTWEKPQWDDNGMNGKYSASAVKAYRVYRAESPGPAPLASTDEIEALNYELVKIVYNTNSFIDTTIDTTNSSIIYYYKVSAVDDQGIEGDMSVPAYYYNNPTYATKTPEDFSCIVDSDGKITIYFKYNSDIDKYYIYRSYNKRYYSIYKTILPSELTLDASTGEVFARVTLSDKLNNDDIWYLKISAHDTADTFRSNLTYYVKVEKFSLLKDNKYVLQAEDMLQSVKVRDVHYAWYASYLYPNSDVAKDSLWDYDIRKDINYTLTTKFYSDSNGNNGNALYFDPMGAQHPPRATSPSVAFGSSHLVSDEVTWSTADDVLCDLKTTRETYLNGYLYLEDTVRPILSANSKNYSGDTYKYNYITAYNDDGFSFWQDSDYDGVDLSEIYYRQTQIPLLQHGMEGSDVKLAYDVDPWTFRNPVTLASDAWLGLSAEVYDATHDIYITDPKEKYYYDFWPTVMTDTNSTVEAWDKNDFDWVGGRGRCGGCAYYIGQDSGTAIMARDYFAEGHGDMTNFKITWRENYFGPLYSNTWPGYAGIWEADAHTWTFKYPENRPQRKDNCLSYDLYGNGIDYLNDSYNEQLDRNAYDIYQEEFKFSWNPPESGKYDIDMYFYETNNSGTYLVILEHNGNFIGQPSIIDLSKYGTNNHKGDLNNPNDVTDSPYDSPESRAGHFEGFLQANFPLTFIFCPLGTSTNIDFDHNYDFSKGSSYELYLDRIEFTRTDSN